MQKISNVLIGILISFLLVQVPTKADSQTAPRPTWVRAKPNADALYKYYLGMASESGSETRAIASARILAREQAIHENFGGLTKIKSEVYQNNAESQSTMQSEEVSPQVIVQDFEEVGLYVERNGPLYLQANGEVDKILSSTSGTSGASGALPSATAWVLYRYKKAAIEREKNRISRISTEELYHVPLIVGSEENAKQNGTIEIKSTPPGIGVRIDGQSQIGEMEIRTPLKLLGLFKPGPHTIEFDDPRFKLLSKEISLKPGTTSQVTQKMQIAVGKLQIKLNTEGAKIRINHKNIDATVLTQPLTFAAEMEMLIEVQHPEMKSFSKAFILHRDEELEEVIELTPKPSAISVLAEQAGASVYIDGVEISQKTPVHHYSLPFGTHVIVVSKDKFQDKEINIDLRGGQNRSINVGRLQVASQSHADGKKTRERKLAEERASNDYEAKPASESESKHRVKYPYLDLWLERHASIFGTKAFSELAFMQFGFMQDPIQQVQDKTLLVSFGYSKPIFTNLAYESEFAVGVGTAGVEATSHSGALFRYRLGLPIVCALSNNVILSLGPDLLWSYHTFSMSNGAFATHQVDQVGTGASFRILFGQTNQRLGFRFSTHNYADVDGFRGQSIFMTSLEFAVGH